MRVIIAGSRDLTNLTDVERAVELSGYKVTEVVSGRARGIDQLGEEWAKQRKIPIKIFEADWRKHGRYEAGFIRNEEMGLYADALVAVWDGQSNGTKNMIEIMQVLNKRYFVYRPNEALLFDFFL